MHYVTKYESPLGAITLAARDGKLTGLWFVGQKYDCAGLPADAREDSEQPIFMQARTWLDAYFAGGDPGSLPPVAPAGTEFQMRVWSALAEIPYGELTTYGALAEKLGAQSPSGKTSARAVGGAVGKNPISIILPCHRVVGASRSLTGYAGGLERKRALLALEGHAETNG